MRATILAIALTLFRLLPAWGAEVLILQSGRSPVYAEALRGFHSVSRLSSQKVVLSDYAEVDVVRLVTEERPRLILALGDRALAAARKVRDLPVVSLLSPTLTFQKPAAENIGGITTLAAPEQYLKLISSFGVKRFGVLYDPKKTGRYLKRIEQESRQLGLNLVAEPVASPRDIQTKLAKIGVSAELLWMLPDSTVCTPINLEAFILFSMTHRIPVVTFSRRQLDEGAAASVDLDHFDLGLQAGEMTIALLNGTSRRVPTVDPRKTVVHINDSVSRKVGGRLPGSMRPP